MRVCPPLLCFGRGEREEREWGGGGNSDEGPYTCGTLGIYMHFGTTPSPHPQESVSPPLWKEQEERGGGGVTITMGDQTKWYYRYINCEGSVKKTTFASIINKLINVGWTVEQIRIKSCWPVEQSEDKMVKASTTTTKKLVELYIILYMNVLFRSTCLVDL